MTTTAPRAPHFGSNVTELWPEALDRANELAFGDFGAAMPYCCRPALLRDLVREMPQDCAQYTIWVTELGSAELDGEALHTSASRSAPGKGDLAAGLADRCRAAATTFFHGPLPVVTTLV